MSRKEDIDIQIFRLDKDRKLAIQAKWQMGKKTSTTIGQVEINSDQGPFACLQDEAVLTEKPYGETIPRNLERTNRLHICAARDQRRKHQFNLRFPIVRVVPSEVVTRHWRPLHIDADLEAPKSAFSSAKAVYLSDAGR